MLLAEMLVWGFDLLFVFSCACGQCAIYHLCLGVLHLFGSDLAVCLLIGLMKSH